jgi:D-glycero-alpha-D-manno-heptose-7-phosphate kinase
VSIILTRAPLRISLGGGGTDLPSYFSEHEGFLIAGAIDKYVYLLTHTAFQRRYRMKYSELEEVDNPQDIRHPILRESICRHWEGEPLEIASLADVPAGTGLGSSGAYTVAVLKSLALARHLATTPAGLAEDACHIEIDILGEPVGKQDPYAAAHGGICAYTFHRDGSVEVEPLTLSGDTLDKLKHHLLLFYTGQARSASQLLRDQARRTRASDQAMLQNLHRIKEIGLQSRALLEQGDLEGFAELMDAHWQTKRERSPGMETERVDELYRLARLSGCVGGKLVGAGGGGFLLVYATHPEDTRLAMARAGAPELGFDFEFGGCQGTEYQ